MRSEPAGGSAGAAVERTRSRPSIHMLRIVLFSGGYFVLAMIIAIIAFGTDMDQLRSRSSWSRGAAAVHDVLWFPHDAALRALPNGWLSRNLYAIPLALVINSLAWGTGLYALWQLLRRALAATRDDSSPTPSEVADDA